MQHERVAGCEVVVSHLAKFGNGRVRCLGVAPCDLFLIISRDFGGNADLDANVLGVSGMGRASDRKRTLAWTRKPPPPPAPSGAFSPMKPAEKATNAMVKVLQMPW